MQKDGFQQLRFSNNLDGTEDDQIKIRRIEEYTTPSGERKFTLLEESESESEFTEVDTDYANDLTECDSELESD